MKNCNHKTEKTKFQEKAENCQIKEIAHVDIATQGNREEINWFTIESSPG